MKKETQELVNQLKKETDIRKFTRDNDKVFIDNPLVTYLDMLLQKYNLIKADVIRKAGLTPVYGYQIFDGKREPKRDKVIQLAIGFGLPIEETQRLLKNAGYGELYPKRRRDVLFIYAINNGFNIDEVEKLLYEMKEKGLESI